MNHFLIRAAAIFSFLVCLAGLAQAQTPAPATGIRVLVYGIHYGGNIVYNYKVINNGDTPFNNFTIGSEFDSSENSEFPQLLRRPIGWTYGEKGEVGREIILAPGSTNQPPNWKPWMYGHQDTYLCYLEWDIPRGDGSNDIRPGQTLTGFSVTIPLADSKLILPLVTGLPVPTGPDEKYLKGNFKVGFGSEKNFQEAWGTLEREDVTPPTVAVTLTPNILHPNRKLASITASISVKDDYDAAPDIKLESITSNEILDKDDIKGAQYADVRQFQLKAEHTEGSKTGRIYTVTYSATDGSGNKATASATVTVLHDERGHDERGHEDRHDEKDKKDKDEHKRDR